MKLSKQNYLTGTLFRRYVLQCMAWAAVLIVIGASIDFTVKISPAYYGGDLYYSYRTLYTGCLCFAVWAAIVLILTYRLLRRASGYIEEVQMAANAFGDGRSVYISGLPYSFENSRVLYRSILWSAHDEESLHKWFSSNFNVEVHAYVKNGKYCVVNNTYEPQSTTVYRGDGSSFGLDLEANEIRWYEL